MLSWGLTWPVLAPGMLVLICSLLPQTWGWVAGKVASSCPQLCLHRILKEVRSSLWGINYLLLLQCLFPSSLGNFFLPSINYPNPQNQKTFKGIAFGFRIFSGKPPSITLEAVSVRIFRREGRGCFEMTLDQCSSGSLLKEGIRNIFSSGPCRHIQTLKCSKGL